MRDVLKFDEVDMKLACTAGGLNMLTVIPQYELVKFGIPFLCNIYEFGVDDKKKKKWDASWVYFEMQWLPFLDSWNVCRMDGNLKNRTNNVIDSYNCWMNSLFLKKPSLVEFVYILKQESIAWAEKLDDDVRINLINPPEYQGVILNGIQDDYQLFKEDMVANIGHIAIVNGDENIKGKGKKTMKATN